jgi:hypothetical protein
MAKQMKRTAGHKAGGGVNSNKVVKKPLKTGGPNRAQSPCAVNQIGNHVGSTAAVEKLDAGKALPSKLGNELVNNVGTGGPGKGRTLYGQSGIQQQYGTNGSPRPEATPWYRDYPAKTE